MHVVDGVEMVDVREAAALASRSPETIRRWVWSGKVTATKYGTKLLIPRSQFAPSEVAPPSGPTLAEWAAGIAARATERPWTPGPSASDLLLEDRAERSPDARP
ncbi:MAG: helix-turn-helix domain-containing protein [Propionibacteriales bacterium]|nr:helix-turn-helix domain-containing protein [Propionibacteriales bacterium]